MSFLMPKRDATVSPPARQWPASKSGKTALCFSADELISHTARHSVRPSIHYKRCFQDGRSAADQYMCHLQSPKQY